METTLEIIAARLEGFEETIISKLIDRAQFCANCSVYQPGKSGFAAEDKRSLFDVRLWYQEEMDARFGRFCVPEERPFSPGLPNTMRDAQIQNDFLAKINFLEVTLCPAIKSSYLELVAAICESGDDGHYGSSTEHDVYSLQAIARRIHFGALYVGESKFRQDNSTYTELVQNNDAAGLLEKLTRKSVEDAIIERVHDKVAYLQGRINTQVRHLIDPAIVLQYYRDTIIPLTKEGEIMYLVRRVHFQQAERNL